MGLILNDQLIENIINQYIRWIDGIRHQYEHIGRYLSDPAFNEVNHHFPKGIADRAKIIEEEKLPHPSFADFGFPALDYWKTITLAGITYGDLIFITPKNMSPTIVFHEAVHVVQTLYLGDANYNKTYGISTLHDGYRDNPLEKTAYKFEDRFKSRALSKYFIKRIRCEATMAFHGVNRKVAALNTREA